MAVDLGADGVGDLCAWQDRVVAVALQDEPRLVRRPLLEDGDHPCHVLLLVGKELGIAHEQVSDDLVGGGDHAALVGRGVAHDDDPLLLQLHARLGRDEGVGPFHDGACRRGAVGQEEAFPVVGVDGLGTSPSRDEEVGLGGEGELPEEAGELVDGDPLLEKSVRFHGRLAVQGLKALGAAAASEEHEAPLVQRIRVEGIQVLLQEDAGELFVARPLGIEERRGPVQDEADLHPGIAVQHDAHGVACHVAVGAAGELHAEGVVHHVDAEVCHGDLGEADHAGRGDAELLVVDADRLAGHDADAQEIAAIFGDARDALDHGVVHVLVRAEFDRLVFAVVVHHRRELRHAVLGHEDVEEGVRHAVLQLVEPERLQVALAASLQVPRFEDQHEFRSTLVDVLVLQVLRVGKDEVLTEDGVRVGDEIVAVPRDHRAPPAAGDVGEAYVVAETEAAEEEGDSEGEGGGKIRGELPAEFGEIGRVEPEGERLFLRHVEVRLQGVLYEDEAAAEDGAAHLVQVAVSGVVVRHDALGLGEGARIYELTVGDRGVEAYREEFG